MNRQPNWPTRLALFIEEKEKQPFAWGSNDCCLFTCDWIAILTQIDPAAEFQLRGAYTTALGAERILKEHGGLEVLAEAWFKAHGRDACPISHAGRGDVVVFRTENGPMLGVCLGAMSAGPGKDGVQFLPTLEAVTAYKI